MRRWIERSATLLVLLVAAGLLLLCWMPAYVGVDDHRPRHNRPARLNR